VRAASRQPWVSRSIEVINEKGAALFGRIQGDRDIPCAPANAAKRFGVLGVGFSSDHFAIAGTGPIVGAAGAKKSTAEHTKGLDQLAGIAALKGSPGKFQKKPLEGLLRLRRVIWIRISWIAYQECTSNPAKRLKTIGLHLETTLDSQIESREYAGEVPTYEMAQMIPASHFEISKCCSYRCADGCADGVL